MSRQVTIDTESSSNIFPGARVVWYHTPRGGYGYKTPVEAKVISYSNTQVRIEVALRNGEKVIRSVDIKNLRWKI